MNNDFNLGGGMPDLSKPSIDPRDYKTIKCSNCGSITFIPGSVIKEIPGSAVGQAGEPVLFPLNVYICSECHKIIDFDIKAYKLEKDLENEKDLKNKEEIKTEKTSSLIL